MIKQFVVLKRECEVTPAWIANDVTPESSDETLCFGGSWSGSGKRADRLEAFRP